MVSSGMVVYSMWSNNLKHKNIKKVELHLEILNKNPEGTTTTLHSGTVDSVEIDVIEKENIITAGYPVNVFAE